MTVLVQGLMKISASSPSLAIAPPHVAMPGQYLLDPAWPSLGWTSRAQGREESNSGRRVWKPLSYHWTTSPSVPRARGVLVRRDPAPRRGAVPLAGLEPTIFSVRGRRVTNYSNAA